VLSELRVRQLGVIEDLTLVLGPGLTALSGETGAGKTLVVDAIELLLGGRAEGLLVRPGASEAVVEGRFVLPGGAEPEIVLGRVVPADGRSRAYVDGRMATVATLAERGDRLVDLHGQHAHQSLFSASAQRDALDLYAGVDRAPREAARRRLREVEQAIDRSGGDAAGRGRETELLHYQLTELESACLDNPAEDDDLAVEEERLARAAAHRAAALAAYESLSGDEQVQDMLGQVVARLAGHPPLASVHERLRGASAELADISADLRHSAETLEEDPERLAEVTARRALLRDLCRKYGGAGGGLGGVLAFETGARARLAELEGLEALGSRLEEERAECRAELHRISEQLGQVRRGAATSLGAAVEGELHRLAMPRARFVVGVGARARERSSGTDDLRQLAGEDVTFLLAANPGEPLLPLSAVASGGELARAMLALRLVLIGAQVERRSAPVAEHDGPRTLVFDEVDAGVGGEAALAVGRALAQLGQRYQVLVVTHLAQVAALADAQIAVSKVERGGRAIAVAAAVSGEKRIVELSRMLSGQPDSRTARLHAAELLEAGRAAPA
jgi:DNA repair protein RecN (Recombination protein N)